MFIFSRFLLDGSAPAAASSSAASGGGSTPSPASSPAASSGPSSSSPSSAVAPSSQSSGTSPRTPDGKAPTPGTAPNSAPGAKPSDAGQPGQAAAKVEAARKLRVKLENEEVELSEDEVIRGYQKAAVSNRRFQEAADKEKKADRFAEALRTDPMSLLTNPALGVDLAKFREGVENWLADQLSESFLTPEQKQARENERDAKKFREQEAKQKSDAQNKRSEEIKKHHATEYTKKFTEALAAVNLPKNEETVRRMASYTREAVRKGYDVDMRDVAELVREDIRNEHRSVFGGLDGDDLTAALGEETVARVRKAALAKVQSETPSFVQPPHLANSGERKETQTQKRSLTDWRAGVMKNIR